MSLISLLFCANGKKNKISGNTIGFLSYGSGSKSKIFQGKIKDNWEHKIEHLKVMEDIQSREIISFNSYENLHNRSLKSPLIKQNNIVLESLDERENKIGFRYYNKA